MPADAGARRHRGWVNWGLQCLEHPLGQVLRRHRGQPALSIDMDTFSAYGTAIFSDSTISTNKDTATFPTATAGVATSPPPRPCVRRRRFGALSPRPVSCQMCRPSRTGDAAALGAQSSRPVECEGGRAALKARSLPGSNVAVCARDTATHTHTHTHTHT